MTPAPRRAAFLDRDGVINIDTGYVGHPDRFVFAPGAPDALARLAAAGYLLIVVTNQSGIGRGYYSSADFEAVDAHMKQALTAAGAPIVQTYHCPHTPEAGCTCRKPAPGMIREALTHFDIDPACSVMIGDKPSDIAAGRAAAIGRCLRIGSPMALDESRPDGVFPSLTDCVDHLLRAEGRIDDPATPGTPAR